jgi:hypothetical protein
MKPPKNPEKPTTSEEKEILLNARAKNCLYESLSMDIFNQVFTLKTTNEIWLKLHELHDGTLNVREQKHYLVLNEYNSFAIKDNELVRDMCSLLNLIINVTKPPKSLGPPIVVLVQRTLDNPVDAHNHSTSSVSVSFSLPKNVSPVTQMLQHIGETNKLKRITIT